MAILLPDTGWSRVLLQQTVQDSEQKMMMSGGRHSSEFSSPPKHVASLGAPADIFPPITTWIMPYSSAITNIVCQVHDRRALEFQFPSIHISFRKVPWFTVGLESGTSRLRIFSSIICISAGLNFPKLPPSHPPNHPHQPASRTDNCLVQESNQPLGFLADLPRLISETYRASNFLFG